MGRLRPLGLALVVVAGGGCVRAPGSSGAVLARDAVAIGPLPRAADAYPLCPPALAGVHTDVQDVEGGVVLDVTGNDVDAAASIRARAGALLAAAHDAEHTDFSAEARGGLAHCPVVVQGTRVSTVAIDRGVRFVVLAGDGEVEWLRREARARFAELRVPTAASPPALAHCPNVLPSAITDVSDSPDGVRVTVVSRDPDVTEVIRARSWHLSQEARGKGPVHEDGAGPLQCPVVVDATAVDVVEIPGGAQITMRPDPGGDVARLRRIVRARAAAVATASGDRR